MKGILSNSLNTVTKSLDEFMVSDAFRGVNEKVPAVEKFVNETDTNPETLEELGEFGETLETGDCIIVHCTHTFGKLTQIGTHSCWDHVGMIVKCAEEDVPARLALMADKPIPKSQYMAWPEPRKEKTEVFEAMGVGCFPYPFTAHVTNRGDTFKYMAVRRLRNRKGEPLDREQKRKIEECVREFWGRPYEAGKKGYLEMARAEFNLLSGPNIHKKRDKSREALDNMFCSELVTEAYQAAGILPELNLNSNEVMPSMFAPGNTIDKYLEAEDHGFRLTDVEIFKAPGTPLHQAISAKRNACLPTYLQIKEDPKPLPSLKH
mmetsp:Transcript_18114/g.19634  ORF Transcript_18114/g.19634 Transcript_18114/m.19634 type:complete len:320 (+) Transcript_18114:130-1089(+)